MGLEQLKFTASGSSVAYLPPNRPALAYPFTMSSLFSNNAQVFYRPGSLSVGGTGTVVNAGRKAKRV